MKEFFAILSVMFICGCAHNADIHNLTAQGKIAQLEKLISSNPNLIEARSEDGQTPLHLAAYHGWKSEVIESRINNGYNRVTAMITRTHQCTTVAAAGNV